MVFSSAASAVEPPEYARSGLHLPGQLLSLAEEDLDGDGLQDIAAFSLVKDKRGPTRTVSVFFQRRGAGFQSSPDQSWGLDPEAVVYDIGPLQKNGKSAICYIRPDGLCAYQISGRTYGTKPVCYVRGGSVFSQKDPLDLPRWPFIFDGGGSDPSLLLMPSINSLSVYASSSGGSYKQVDSVPLPTQTSFIEDIISVGEGPLRITHKIPLLEMTACNSPAKDDLLVTLDDNADVWQKNPASPGFGNKPLIRLRPGLMERTKDGLESASTEATDIDGDGRCDMVVTKLSGGIAQTRSLVFIFPRRSDGSFPAKPSQTIITEGVVGPKILDLNGDGREDIILPSVKMGISNFINMLTSRQINMMIAIYMQDGNGRYPDRPTKEKPVSFKLDISNMGKNARPVMAFGRFTKERGYGLAVAAKEDRVSVYTPDRYSILSDNPAVNLSVPAPSELDAKDLNGDGIDDLVMSYKRVKDNNRDIYVFISK